jgi:hypothetical protein
MKEKRFRTGRLGLLVFAACLVLLVAAPGGVAQPRNSEQVVFSGTGFGSFGGGSPFGFWIWCEADSENPYAGECNGAMYFYALGITKHVDGTIAEPAEGDYVMTVTSRGGSVACTLANVGPASKGPTNTVNVVCSSPAGAGASTNAVVNVTGP